jgi:dienelactone hydrolase
LFSDTGWLPSGEDAVKELMSKSQAKMEEDSAKVVPLAIADGRAAVSYVRKHAAEYGVSPQRIGLMGFSAGGTVTAANAFKYSAESRPDFVAPIYAHMGVVTDATVPSDSPPIFIVAASDDQLGLAPDSVSLYSKMDRGKEACRDSYVRQRRPWVRNAQTESSYGSMDRAFW